MVREQIYLKIEPKPPPIKTTNRLSKLMEKETIDLLFNITGIAGTATLILAYLLLQAGKIRSDEMRYPLLNLIGAVLLLISLFRFWNLASVIIELFWIAISIYGIWKVKCLNMKINK